MDKFFTLGGLAARSFNPEPDALGCLVLEVEQGRLMCLDSIHWSERREPRGRVALQERTEFRSMRVTPAALLAWADRFPTNAAGIFSAAEIRNLAPTGAGFTLEL